MGVPPPTPASPPAWAPGTSGYGLPPPPKTLHGDPRAGAQRRRDARRAPGRGVVQAPPSVSGGAHPASQPSGSRRDHNPSAPPRGTRAPDAGSCPRTDAPHEVPPPREIERDSLRGLSTAEMSTVEGGSGRASAGGSGSPRGSREAAAALPGVEKGNIK